MSLKDCCLCLSKEQVILKTLKNYPTFFYKIAVYVFPNYSYSITYSFLIVNNQNEIFQLFFKEIFMLYVVLVKQLVYLTTI